jgi:signal transduction histidine kinase
MSFRARILVVVVAASVVPLALVGLWLTGSAVRSSDRFLQDRLEVALEETVSLVAGEWTQLRSQILFFAEDPAVQRVLGVEGQLIQPSEAGVLEARFARLNPGVRGLEIQDATGKAVWSDRRSEIPSALELAGASVEQALPIYGRRDGRGIGTLVVDLASSSLLPPGRLPPVTAGMAVAMTDPDGQVLVPTPFDASLLASERFTWMEDEWRVVRHTLERPSLTIVVAATLGPFAEAFGETARRGTTVLVVIAFLALLATAALTTRMTRSLHHLSEAAAAVSSGDLSRSVPEAGTDELGTVARAFNAMTESLRRTLRQLAGQESLAAVGEFAAGLAHEVRNPLTAVQIDLQYVESELPPDSPLREPQSKALAEIRRLNATVGDALRVARSGQIRTRPIDLREPLSAAVDAAAPSFHERGALLDTNLGEQPLSLEGDSDALEQLFLNLLLNAAEALDAGGTATVLTASGRDELNVRIRDDGPGMPPEVRERAFEPLFSTRTEGTGLGLPISLRIAVAHGGEIRIENTPGSGTTVVVRLPRSLPRVDLNSDADAAGFPGTEATGLPGSDP